LQRLPRLFTECRDGEHRERGKRDPERFRGP
jgi:hypothetical protein